MLHVISEANDRRKVRSEAVLNARYTRAGRIYENIFGRAQNLSKRGKRLTAPQGRGAVNPSRHVGPGYQACTFTAGQVFPAIGVPPATARLPRLVARGYLADVPGRLPSVTSFYA